MVELIDDADPRGGRRVRRHRRDAPPGRGRDRPRRRPRSGTCSPGSRSGEATRCSISCSSSTSSRSCSRSGGATPTARRFIEQFGEVVRRHRVSPDDQPVGAADAARHRASRSRCCIREDFLGQLEALAVQVPQIMQRRFRLDGLSPDQAIAAIREPASIDDPRLRTRAVHVQRGRGRRDPRVPAHRGVDRVGSTLPGDRPVAAADHLPAHRTIDPAAQGGVRRDVDRDHRERPRRQGGPRAHRRRLLPTSDRVLPHPPAAGAPQALRDRSDQPERPSSEPRGGRDLRGVRGQQGDARRARRPPPPALRAAGGQRLLRTGPRHPDHADPRLPRREAADRSAPPAPRPACRGRRRRSDRHRRRRVQGR